MNDFLKDHMFMMIHFNTGHRSGMSANVMFIDYETSIKSRKEHDPNLTIVIRKHKMYSTASPAMLIFNKSGTTSLEVHIHMVHPQIACDG